MNTLVWISPKSSPKEEGHDDPVGLSDRKAIDVQERQEW